jgi:hypothetical protein
MILGGYKTKDLRIEVYVGIYWTIAELLDMNV